MSIHPIYLSGNPIAFITLVRNPHCIESNSLEKSIFTKSAGLFKLEMYCRVYFVDIKDSAIWRPLTKAFGKGILDPVVHSLGGLQAIWIAV